MLRQHQRQPEGGRGRQRIAHAGADLAPLPGRAQTRSGAQHVQRQHQAEQDHRHGDEQCALRLVAVQQARPQRRHQRKAVEHQQRQRHRQARHGGIQAQALHGDQHADERQRLALARRKGERHLVDGQQRTHHQRRDRAAEGDGRGHIDTVVEGQARGDVVSAHDEGDEQQREEGQGAEGAGGRGHGRAPAPGTARPKGLAPSPLWGESLPRT